MLHGVILRGIPGSGKSTLTTKEPMGCKVVSADQFFMKSGEYKFDPTLIADAHAECLTNFIEYLDFYSIREHANETLFVDNTNIHAFEFSVYYRMAEINPNTDVKIVTVKCDPFFAHARNVHGVPLTVVQRMAISLDTEFVPPWWKHEIIDAK